MCGEREIIQDSQQRAIPIPKGIFDPEAVRRALQHYSAAVREDQRRPRPEKLLPTHWFEPLDSSI